MAKNLLNKLSTLIQASITDAVRSERKPSRRRLGKNIEREIKGLHQQVAAADEDEQTILQRQTALEKEIMRLDEQADSAVAAGRDAEARHAIQQMEMAKQRLNMLTSELESHRRAVSELRQQVNELEALIEAAKHEETAAESESPASPEVQIPLSEAIRQARDQVKSESKEEVIRVKVEVIEEDAPAQDDAAIEKDLAIRRSRLAKPD